MTPPLAVQEAPEPSVALREREAFLGRLIGDVLRSHASRGTFELVESIRALTRRRRRAPEDGTAHDELMQLVESMSVPTAVEVVRACSLYFQLTNIAEHVHREQRRRERAIARETGLQGSIETMTLPPDVARAEVTLAAMDVALVFTAHPTEVQRRTVIEKLEAIAGLLATLDDRRNTPEEVGGLERELRAQITLLW